MRREVLRSLRVLARAGALLAGTAAALAAQEEEPYRARSPGAAVALSVLGTVAPIALGLAKNTRGGLTLTAGGLVLGPAVGYRYAGDVGRGMAHAGIRAAVLGTTVGGAVLICSSVDECDFFGPNSGAFTAAAMLALGGIVATTVLAVVDIVRVDDWVRARNPRLGAVSLRPAYFPASRAAGLLVTWRR